MPAKFVGLVAAVCALSVVSPAAGGDPRVAALQIALHERGVYSGTIDGVAGAKTASALRSLPVVHRRGSGPSLGVFAPRVLGSRLLAAPMIGFDVGQLQWELAWHGFPSGSFDGRFGPHLAQALERFQRFADLMPDGVAGPATLAALRRPLVVSLPRLLSPVSAPVGDRYGPRGDRFHAGIDFEAPYGTPVEAAASGVVTWSGERSGWGMCVVIAHGGGMRTLYAHLSESDVQARTHIGAGKVIGRVGSTGDATGPHLHFEVRFRGAAIDPLLALRQ